MGEIPDEAKLAVETDALTYGAGRHARDAEVAELEQRLDDLRLAIKSLAKERDTVLEQLNGYIMENEEMRENYGITQEALAAAREQLTELERIIRQRTGDTVWECPDCGLFALSDEDGCCGSCGSDLDTKPFNAAIAKVKESQTP